MVTKETKVTHRRQKQVTYYARHRESLLALKREQYRVKVSIGLCPLCCQPTNGKRKTCDKCSDYANRKKRESRARIRAIIIKRRTDWESKHGQS